MAKAQDQPQQEPPPEQEDQSHPVADQFSDPEMEQVQRFGQALGGSTEFDDQVEQALHARGAFDRPRPREHGAKKMHQAQTAGSEGLGPSESEQTLAQQKNALLQRQAQTGAAGASQAQQGMGAQPTPPPAPTGPQGVTQPYSSQAGAVGGSGQPPQPQGPPAAPEGGSEAPPEQT
jgi:hypothetical protein